MTKGYVFLDLTAAYGTAKLNLGQPLPRENKADLVTYAELYEGTIGSPRRSERLQELEELVAVINVLPIDFEVARRFAEIRADLRRRGEPIPDIDALIAATALRHNLTLVSRDVHFSRVGNLQIYQHT